MIGRIAAQARLEAKLTLRNSENLLAAIGIPVGLLALFTFVDVLPDRIGRPIDFLAPGALALAVIASSMVTLSIGTAFERQLGVLKRLGATPLGRGGLLAGKASAVLLVEAAQAVAIVAIALALGWSPDPSIAAAGIVLLGTAAFAAIGFALAGVLRAEANLGVSNALFIAFLALGGIAVPVASLPAPLQTVARVLPAEALATSLRAALDGTALQARPLLVLAAWATGACAVAAARFRWE